jgi:hypothetical protein
MLVRLCAGQLDDGLGGTARDSREYVGIIIYGETADLMTRGAQTLPNSEAGILTQGTRVV